MDKKMFKNFAFIGLIALLIYSSIVAGFAEETYTWVEKSAILSKGICRLGVVEVDNKLYIIGGYTNSSTCCGDVIQYSPDTDTLITKASLKMSRTAHGTTSYNGKIYVFGGQHSSSTLKSVEEYNPATDTWTSKANMPVERTNCKAVTVGNKIYVFGGNRWEGSTTIYTQQVDVYNPETDTWETKSSMPYGRKDFSSTVVDSKVYLIGSYYGDDENSKQISKKVDVYNTVTDTWETAPDLINPKFLHGSVYYNGKVYTIGGIHKNGQTIHDGIDILDLSTNNWTTVPFSPKQNFRSFGYALINNKFYIIGGSFGGISYSKKIIELNLPMEEPTPSSPTNLTATPGNAKVNLNWDEVEGADTYTVKRATTTGGPYTAIAENITETSYLDTDVVNGTTYYYVVTAVNTAGESEPSNETSATPVAPIVNRALLNITMQNNLIKEYDMSMTQVGNFIDWYNSSTGDELYTINKSYNIGPYLSRKDYLVRDMIVCFEVMEYENIE